MKTTKELSLIIFLVLAVLSFEYGCALKSSDETTSPSPSPSPSNPTSGTWTATPGTIPDGTWHDPGIAPDVSHTGAYGGISYAPNGDLYFFYETGTYPNETLKNVIRRAASSTWSVEYTVGDRLRTANLYFEGNQPYFAGESGGSASVYTSTNYSNVAPQTVNWTLQQYFQAADSNLNGDGVYGPAYLVKNGSDFMLFHSYLYYSVVTGASLYGMNLISQSAGVWPAAGSFGTPLDNTHLVSIFSYPRAAAGAFTDGSGNFLAFSKIALKSTDGGTNFSQIMNSGVAADDLTGVLATCKNPTDDSILIANYYPSGNIAIWGTQDFSATISKLATLTGTPMRGAMACIKNLLVLVYTNGPSDEKYIDVIKSVDGGTTWSSATTIVDATNAGVNPEQTIGSLALSANASGDLTLGYSVVSGTTHRGAYIKEFYQ